MIDSSLQTVVPETVHDIQRRRIANLQHALLEVLEAHPEVAETVRIRMNTDRTLASREMSAASREGYARHSDTPVEVIPV